jgi:hypothetical protein
MWMQRWLCFMGRAGSLVMTPRGSSAKTQERSKGWPHEASQKTDRLLAQKQLMSASKKSGQLTCYETGQFYLLPTVVSLSKIHVSLKRYNAEFSKL